MVNGLPITSNTRILTGSDVRSILDMPSCIAEVERGFRLAGESIQSGVAGFHTEAGGFHVKAALLSESGSPPMFAAKVNANFPANPSLHNLPTIQGMIALFEGLTGRLLAVMDSISVTLLRTAAASALAARELARPDAATLTIVGCGAQAGPHLAAICAVRQIKRVFALDSNIATARRFAMEHSRESLDVVACSTLEECAPLSDIIATCTPSRNPYLGTQHVTPGAFVAAVGADSENKQELDVDLLRHSTVVVDSLDQCATIGELHHAMDSGAMYRTDVHADLTSILNGIAPGRRDSDEIIVFDSTGVAFQDVVCASLAYRRALELDLGADFSFTR